jgi:hypothetical protein
MQTTKKPVFIQESEKYSVLVHTILVSILLTLFTYSIVITGEHFLPDWNGNYLVIIAALISIEAQYSRRRLGQAEQGQQVVVYRFAELVFFLVLLKIFMYLLRGFGSIANDFLLWRDNFIYTFFSGEYLIAILILAVIWGFATYLSSQLFQLEADEDILEMERESRMATHRIEIREKLAITILMIGVVMTVLGVLVYFTRETRALYTAGLSVIVVPLVLYFIIGLVLLSLTQFSVLRVYWILDKIPFRSNLVLQWVIYSLGLLLLVGLIALLLPTNYSVGILDFLNKMLSILLWVLWAIAFIIMLPIAFVISMIYRLFGTSSANPPPSFTEILPKAPAQTEPSVGWADWLKSLFFWAVFLGIVIFSVIYYIRQNKNLMERLRKIRFFKGVKLFFIKISGFFRRANKKISTAIRTQLHKFQNRQKSDGSSSFGFLNPKRLSPKEQVKFYYYAVIRRGAESGVPRIPTQTPAEYQRNIQVRFPEVADDIGALTAEFEDARYSLHETSSETARKAKNNWERVRQVFFKFTRKK